MYTCSKVATKVLSKNVLCLYLFLFVTRVSYNCHEQNLDKFR